MVGRRAPRTQCFVGHPLGPYGLLLRGLLRIPARGNAAAPGVTQPLEGKNVLLNLMVKP